MSSSRLSEEDAATFMNRFDKAFLDLYPSFVTEINRLLRPEYQLEITHTHSMNTEIRIFALIRLGVKESAEIAGLLFYSPQTIYNYRSAVKAKAINRDTFEEDVQRLCITNA
jgi:DNA-binding NarL/FixJ family response regulator